LLPVSQLGRVEVHPGGDLALEGGASREQPERKQQKREWAGLEEDKDALPEYIASDQSAVKIDAQNR